MIQIIKKSEQFNNSIFDGRFHANKPVFNGKASVKPYSSLFYWSNGYVEDDCEFGLHPHQGFEIMSFLFDGKISHYDTQTRIWTDLEAGGFQIIQSNRGVQHQERISAGSRAFQIWFDPHFQEALTKPPTYTDYQAQDFPRRLEHGIPTITYIGDGSVASTLTPNLTIKRLFFDTQMQVSLPLKADFSYTFYVLKGDGMVNNAQIATDDAIRVSATSLLPLDFKGELFYIETPTVLAYPVVWN